jgi:hypothetical protein
LPLHFGTSLLGGALPRLTLLVLLLRLLVRRLGVEGVLLGHRLVPRLLRLLRATLLGFVKSRETLALEIGLGRRRELGLTRRRLLLLLLAPRLALQTRAFFDFGLAPCARVRR